MLLAMDVERDALWRLHKTCEYQLDILFDGIRTVLVIPIGVFFLAVDFVQGMYVRDVECSEVSKVEATGRSEVCQGR